MGGKETRNRWGPCWLFASIVSAVRYTVMARQCLKLSHCMTLVASTMCAWRILRLLGQAEEQTHAKEPATGRGTCWHSAPPVPSQGLSAAPRLPRSPSATHQPPSAFVFSDFFLLPSGRGGKKKKTAQGGGASWTFKGQVERGPGFGKRYERLWWRRSQKPAVNLGRRVVSRSHPTRTVTRSWASIFSPNYLRHPFMC